MKQRICSSGPKIGHLNDLSHHKDYLNSQNEKIFRKKSLRIAIASLRLLFSPRRFLTNGALIVCAFSMVIPSEYSACDSIETVVTGKTHPTLEVSREGTSWRTLPTVDVKIIIFLVANALCEYNVPNIVEGELPGDPPGSGTGTVIRLVITFFQKC